MRLRLFALAALLCALPLFSAGCQTAQIPVYANPTPAETQTPAPATPAPSPSPSPTPSPSPSPTPSPTPSPSPTPTPEPTPTPDPWACHYSPEGPYLCIVDADKGPWAYRDEQLSISVTIPNTGINKNNYFAAEIHSRVAMPFVGFAQKNPKGRKTDLPYKIAREYDAVLAVTGEYISANHNPKGVIIVDGTVLHDKKQATTMAFLPNGEMAVYDAGKVNAKALLALGVRNSYSFGPILVENGKCHPDITKHKLGTAYSWRAAIGQIEPGHNIIIVTKNPIRLTDLAKIFVQYGCKTAYNLDGGYSAALVFMGEQLNKNDDKADAKQRGIPDMLMVGVCAAVPDVKAPVYGTGVLRHYKYKPKPTDGLIKASAAPASTK